MENRVKKTALNPVRIGMMSLGCPKTLVDSEVILGKLGNGNFALVPSVADCDVALLNTCSFIQEAQEESIDKIMELIQLKKENQIKAIVVMGCLVQKFPKQLQAELSEVDAFVGSGEYEKIPEIVGAVSRGGERVFSVGTPGYLSHHDEPRVSLTPLHYRYLKISEGCDHICSFCTIPQFRGKHRSRSLEDVRAEAEVLVSQGAKELIVTGQDTTYFGRDTVGRFQLPELLQALSEVDGLEWVRVLYAYPSCITTELMQVMRDAPKICHYLDMPLQHASDSMLQSMKRGITKRRTIDLIRQFRATVPDLAIRTTFIVGFPGESEDDFEELLNFMTDMQFERLGVFTYSDEEACEASAYAEKIPENIKRERFERAMLHQQEISAENNKQQMGRTLDVLIEAENDEQDNAWVGRSYMDAPEVDGNVYVTSERPLSIGKIYPVKITSTQEYDLIGKA